MIHKTSLHTMVITVFILLAPLHSHASSKNSLDEIDYDISEQRLNILFLFLKQQLKPKEFKQLKAQQILWLKQRKKTCGGRQNFKPKTPAEQNCHTKANRTRNKVLMQQVIQLGEKDKDFNCENAITTPDTNFCASEKLRQYVNTMNLYVYASKQRNQQNKELQEKIAHAQQQWLKYEDAQCNAVYTAWIEGTIRGLMSIDCSTALTKQRTYTLWQDFLTFMDSTPPILPKPEK